jgi:hypothetical protein
MRSVGPAIVFIGLLLMMTLAESFMTARWDALSDGAKSTAYWMATIAMVMFMFAYFRDMFS